MDPHRDGLTEPRHANEGAVGRELAQELEAFEGRLGLELSQGQQQEVIMRAGAEPCEQAEAQA